MQLPFTIQQFLEIFRNYNLTVWPMQIILVIIALGIIFFLWKKHPYSNKIILFALSFLWLWIGIVYHWIFFSTINKPAYVFGALFIFQGILFLIAGLKDKIKFEFTKTIDSMIGMILIACSLIIYPILNFLFGHAWPNNPTFGLPCPTVIFTFGVLLTATKLPKYMVIIPLLWSLIGVSAALSLGIWEDLLLAVSGIIGTILILRRKKLSR